MTVIMPDSNLMNNQGFLLVILLIIILQLRQRKVKLWTLFIMPILVACITIPIVNSELISTFNVAVILAALIIGILVGTLIGKFFEVKIDENGAMILKGSFVAVFIWIVIILLKVYGKTALGGTGLVELNLLTAAFLIMTLGAMVSRRMFVYWKYLSFKKDKVASKP